LHLQSDFFLSFFSAVAGSSSACVVKLVFVNVAIVTVSVATGW